MSVSVYKLTDFLNNSLSVSSVSDYCPNGLQVEGREVINKVVTGVTASQALVDRAVAAGADAILVHHGYFWKGEAAEITGIKKRRIAALLKNDISLIAYHLPLDMHPELGNNVQLARRLGFSEWQDIRATGSDALGVLCKAGQSYSGEQLARHLQEQLGFSPVHIPADGRSISRVGICTGAAQGYIQQMADAGMDAFISGEISEPTAHLATELGIHYYAAGHHATERYGVQALGELVNKQFGVDVEFIDLPVPV